MKAKNKSISVKISVNVKDILERTKEFGKEFEALCHKYALVPDMARDNETNDVYFVVSVKSFVENKDIKMDIEK